MRRVPYFSFAMLLAVVACGGSDPVDDNAKSTAGLPDINAVAPTATGEPHVDTQPARPLPSAASGIPAALQGRWALTAADCTSTQGDTKGLLVITSDGLRFYESHAVPAADVTSDSDSISGNFAFTGEGQSWTKYEALKVDKRGLTRTETNPTASFSYAKCS
jgi:hypothetical protein